jgi:hypothetical protein
MFVWSLAVDRGPEERSIFNRAYSSRNMSSTRANKMGQTMSAQFIHLVPTASTGMARNNACTAAWDMVRAPAVTPSGMGKVVSMLSSKNNGYVPNLSNSLSLSLSLSYTRTNPCTRTHTQHATPQHHDENTHTQRLNQISIQTKKMTP